MKFSETYPNPRALAVEHSLAVPGRGRLSTAAKALIAEARLAGVTFEDERPHVWGPRDDEDLAPEEPEGIPDELRDGHHYARLPSPGWNRQPLIFTGFTPEGFLVKWFTCHRCAQFSAHCECKEGVKPPLKDLTGIGSMPWTND